MKFKTGMNTKSNLDKKPSGSANLANMGDVAPLNRFRRRPKAQVGSADPSRPQDSSTDPHTGIISTDPDASTHTSGHLDPKRRKASNGIKRDISHQDSRKEDQHMVSMSDPSTAPLSLKEQCIRDMKLKRELEKRKNPPKKKSEKEQIAEKVIKLWNRTPHLHHHQVKSPQSKVLKEATELIISALKGNLGVDHPLCVKGRKYNVHDFERAIRKLSTIANDLSYGPEVCKAASEVSLRDFFRRTFLTDNDNKESRWYFYYLSPFMYLTDHELEKRVLRPVGPNYEEKLISRVYDIITDYYDKSFPLNAANKKEVVKFIKYVDDFVKENKHGLDHDEDICSIAKEYCKFVFEENFKHTIGLLFYPNKHNDFFDHCLEVGILHDEYKGRLFKNGSKFFFQLTDAERKAIKNKERKAREEAERIEEERFALAEKQRKEELLKNPPKPYDRKAEMEKKKRKQDIDSCKLRKDKWRKKAKAKGNEKEFDALWTTWVKETKLDLSKLDEFKQSIQHLL